MERSFGGVTSGKPEDKLGIRGSNSEYICIAVWFVCDQSRIVSHDEKRFSSTFGPIL